MAAHPRQYRYTKPGKPIPGRYSYKGRRGSRNAIYVYNTKGLRLAGVVLQQAKSYAVLSSQMWPTHCLLRIEDLHTGVLLWSRSHGFT